MVAMAGMAAVPAVAEPFVFSGVISGGVGYATNPFLRSGNGDGGDAGSALVSVSVAPRLTRTTPRGRTVVSGVYSREEYLRRYGASENAQANLGHTEQLSERLSVNGNVGYSTSTNPLIGANLDRDLPDDVNVSDPLNIGRRSKRLSGNAGLQWQPSDLDSFNVGVNASHSSYKGSTLARDFDQYGGQLGYSRAVDARTRVGVQLAATQVENTIYPNTSSLQPAVTLQRQLSTIWAFNGNLGVILQHVDGGGNSTSLGFGASLCGTYPRTSVCATANRSSSASGLGGLRTSLEFGATLRHELTERSRISAYASYQDSKAQQLLNFGVNKARVLQTRVDYGRDLSERITVGVGGRYQNRKFTQRSADSLAGTINISAKIGRRT